MATEQKPVVGTPTDAVLPPTPPKRLGLGRRGDPFLWLTGGAVALSVLMILGLLALVAANGLSFFRIRPLVLLELDDGSRRLGEIRDREPIPHADGHRIQIKRGNRDLYGADYEWIPEQRIRQRSQPKDAVLVERWEWGNFYGWVRALRTPEGERLIRTATDWKSLRSALQTGQQLHRQRRHLEERIAKVNRRITAAQRKIRSIQYRRGDSPSAQRRVEQLQAQIDALQAEAERHTQELEALLQRGEKNLLRLETADGQTLDLPTYRVVRLYRPNALSFFARMRITLSKVREFLFEPPREANTEGGIFPALFGTVTLVLLMSLFVVPLGVVAAFYLREYAQQGTVVRLIRIAVNNLAGVPSIVYGVFGVGFFIYSVGGTIDRFFFPEFLPTPTWGSGGILWASLTLALLTLPVVIVSTEEALAAVPRSWREASLALGATQFQTVVRILLPATTPGILTGLILAVARAAGEVAPLMITGAVKLAPTLPIDGEFPFFHFNRQFMHLGFHIYDMGFQSPNVEAAKPMVYATTLLLILVVVVLNLTAMLLRNRLQRRYHGGVF